jgi:CBS-domain-containing membrane protein
MLQMRTLAPIKRVETPMADSEKILRDLETLTNTIDLDRADLDKLVMSPETRKSIQHQIARCLHSLRELEFVLEGQKPVDESEADFLI